MLRRNLELRFANLVFIFSGCNIDNFVKRNLMFLIELIHTLKNNCRSNMRKTVLMGSTQLYLELEINYRYSFF